MVCVVPAGHNPLWHFVLSQAHLPAVLLKDCSVPAVGPALSASVPTGKKTNKQKKNTGRGSVDV